MVLLIVFYGFVILLIRNETRYSYYQNSFHIFPDADGIFAESFGGFGAIVRF